MHSRLSKRSASGAALLAVATALCLPAPASAWVYSFQDFLKQSKGAMASSEVSVRKCSGGKLGVYRLRGIVYSSSGDIELLHAVTADFPVRDKWKPLRDVDVGFEASKEFDPQTLAAIAEAYGEFYESVETRWSPGEIQFRHDGLRIFGNQILPPGVHGEDFKPEPGCATP